jgi:hypothetical protein
LVRRDNLSSFSRSNARIHLRRPLMSELGHGEKTSRREYLVCIASISGIPTCSRAGPGRAISCRRLNLTILERKRKDCLRRSFQIRSMLALPRHANMRTHSWLIPQAFDAARLHLSLGPDEQVGTLMVGFNKRINVTRESLTDLNIANRQDNQNLSDYGLAKKSARSRIFCCSPAIQRFVQRAARPSRGRPR